MSTTTNKAAEQTELSTQKLLQQKRDAKLLERFTFLHEKKRLRYDDVMNHLQDEFFITERTIRGLLKRLLPDKEGSDPSPKPGDQFNLFQ